MLTKYTTLVIVALMYIDLKEMPVEYTPFIIGGAIILSVIDEITNINRRR